MRETAYNVTAQNGKTIYAGVPDQEATINIDSFPLHQGRQVVGSHGGDTQPDSDIPRYLRLYQLERLKLSEQITQRYSLDNINEALNRIRSGSPGRVLISMACGS